MIIALAVLLLSVAPNASALPKAAAAAVESAKPLPAAPLPNVSRSETNARAAEATPAETSPSDAQNAQALETIHVPSLSPVERDKILGVRVPSRRTWLLLSIADHSAAVFDAYTTRQAISRGAVEANPLVRPFAQSDGIYAAIQIAPVALDFVARRMQRSHSGLLRRTWWVPQSASTGLLLFAGAHNLTVAAR